MYTLCPVKTPSPMVIDSCPTTPLPRPMRTSSPMVTTGSCSGTWPGITPAESVQYGPITTRAPTRM